MYEERAVIQGFPDYEVSNQGKVYKIRTGRELTLSVVTGGALSVGMVADGYQYRRQVKSLVARAFVEGESDVYDTPIQLDGNRDNLKASNIVWRPRWFSWYYTKQFQEIQTWYFNGPVADQHGAVYSSIFEASIVNGILCKDILTSIRNDRMVFPTGQRFTYI